MSYAIVCDGPHCNHDDSDDPSGSTHPGTWRLAESTLPNIWWVIESPTGVKKHFCSINCLLHWGAAHEPDKETHR